MIKFWAQEILRCNLTVTHQLDWTMKDIDSRDVLYQWTGPVPCYYQKMIIQDTKLWTRACCHIVVNYSNYPTKLLYSKANGNPIILVYNFIKEWAPTRKHNKNKINGR